MVTDRIKEIIAEYEPKYLNHEWESRDWLACWSAQTYYYVCHSSRIMSVCAGLVSSSDEGFHKFLIQHLSEESGHQFLAKRDVKSLGYSLNDIPELPETRLFYEPQYYKALTNPKAFYGYGLMLEVLAITVGKKAYERILGKGLQSEFLRVHVDEDESHVPAVEKIAKSFSQEEQNEIFKNFEQSNVGYLSILNAVSRWVQAQSDPIAQAA